MGKTVMVLFIPEPKVRKETAKPVRKHKDKTAYSRKAKHKTPDWGSFFVQRAKTEPNHFRSLLDGFGRAHGLTHIFCHILGGSPPRLTRRAKLCRTVRRVFPFSLTFRAWYGSGGGKESL